MNKQQNRSFSAIIFDMDGLVLETEITYCIAWKKALLDMGFECPDNFYLSLSGLHYQQVEKKLLAYCGADFEIKKFNQLSADHWRQEVNQHGIPVKKGFFNVLKYLHENAIPFCLATNSSQINTIECLALAGLNDIFSIIITRDQVTRGKPAPDIFLSAAAKLNKPMADCLVIEDSITGLQAAVNSGAKAVFIPSISAIDPVAIDLADDVLNDLDELIEIIQRRVIHPV